MLHLLLLWCAVVAVDDSESENFHLQLKSRQIFQKHFTYASSPLSTGLGLGDDGCCCLVVQTLNYRGPGKNERRTPASAQSVSGFQECALVVWIGSSSSMCCTLLYVVRVPKVGFFVVYGVENERETVYRKKGEHVFILCYNMGT